MAEWLQLENGEWFQFSEGATPEQMQQEAQMVITQLQKPKPQGPQLQASHVSGVQPTEGMTQSGILTPAIETMKNIGRVYPAAETAAQMVTSTYGVPISGLASLFALPFGLEEAEKTRQAVEKSLVYQPQTEGGQQLSEATAYPFKKIEEAGEKVGGMIEEAGYPMTGAAVHSAITAAPVIFGGKSALKSGGEALSNQAKIAVKKGIAKGIRPTVVGKRTASQIKNYYDNAVTAVEKIVRNKEDLKLTDFDGNPSGKLPTTLNEFSQAIEQTKRKIFEEYDSLAKEGGLKKERRPLKYPLKKEKGESVVFEKGKGYIEKNVVDIDLSSTANKLDPIFKNKTLRDLSPETVEYAKTRAEALKGRGGYTALETQEAIQLLNQSLEKFYRDPSPANKGRAFIDSLIANDLRKQLDTSISKATGKDYASLKKEYGALKSIEKEVANRAVVDARKNQKGLIDFSDIFSGHQIISGMLKAEPAAIAGGATAKGISAYIKKLNDPNTYIKNMFSEVDKTINPKAQSVIPTIKKTLPIGTAMEQGGN